MASSSGSVKFVIGFPFDVVLFMFSLFSDKNSIFDVYVVCSICIIGNNEHHRSVFGHPCCAFSATGRSTCGRGMKKAGTRGPGPVYRGGRIVLCCFSSVGTYLVSESSVCGRSSAHALRSAVACFGPSTLRLGPVSLAALRSSGSLLFTRGSSPDGLQPVRSDHAVLSSVGRVAGLRGGRVGDAQLLLHLGSNVDEVRLVERNEGARRGVEDGQEAAGLRYLVDGVLGLLDDRAISSLYFFS